MTQEEITEWATDIAIAVGDTCDSAPDIDVLTDFVDVTINSALTGISSACDRQHIATAVNSLLARHDEHLEVA